MMTQNLKQENDSKPVNRIHDFMAPRSFGSFFGALLLILIFAQAALGSKMDKQLLDAGQLLLTRGQYLESIGLLHEIAAHTQSEEIKATAMFLIAKAEHTYLDNPDAALKRYLQITKQYPETPAASKALFQKAILLFDKQAYPQAIAAFSDYIEKYPTGEHRKAAEVWVLIATPLLKEQEQSRPSVQPPKPAPLASPQKPPVVRVLIERSAPRLVIRSASLITVTEPATGQQVYSGWGPLHLSSANNLMRLNGTKLPGQAYRVASESSILQLNNTAYRGHLIITAEPDGSGFRAVNHVEIEKYLYGVVPREMPDSWAEQALMAQAVAARTYALYVKEKSIHPDYDLEATTASQVYGGIRAESRRSTRAVNATRGQVMTHDGKLIVAYFHSDSGGHTEDPANVWNTDTIPYLRGVPEQAEQQPHVKTWEYFLSYKDAVARLNRYGLDITRLYRIKVTNRSKSGRFSTVLIYSDKGTTELSSNHFRASIGEAKLKSTLFHMYARKGGILFKGKGYGHGVGMSQWGARRMAQSGRTYQDILKFYYKGIKIQNL